MSGVTAIACDATLDKIWQTLPGYPQYGETTNTEVMSRQLLNVEHAMQLARARNCSWLLNIDSDELFFSPGASVGEHFAGLAAAPAETVIYPNCEAIPEREDITDYFREVELFKLPLDLVRLRLAPALAHAERTTPALNPFFHFYANGKSAVRLAAADMAPIGVHRFGRGAAPTAAAQSQRQFILHFACCGFDAFWTKYVTLGRFADKWWGKFDIADAIGPFHLDARDAVAAGRDAALAFYRERVAVSDPDKAGELIRLGLATRLSMPRQIVDRALALRPGP
jgi:hypothetical protein